MDTNDFIKDIIDEYINQVDIFQKSSGGINYDIIPSYKGKEDLEHLIFMEGYIEYPQYIICLRFTIHKTFFEMNNILDCFLCFDKESQLYYPLEYVLDYLHQNTLVPMVIPCISNVLTMKECLQLFIHQISNIHKDIYEICINKNKQQELENIIKQEIYEDKIPEDLKLEDYQQVHDYYIEHLAETYLLNKGYVYFLIGDYETALKKYAKQKKKTRYENIIIELMKEAKQEIQLPYSICYQIKSLYKIEKHQFHKKEILVYAISMIIHSVFWFICYYILAEVSYHILKDGSLYFIGLQQNEIFSCLMLAIITSLASSYLTRDRAYYYLFRKDYNDYKENQMVMESPRQNRFMKKFLAITFIIGYLMIFTEVKNHVVFYEDKFIDHTEFFSLKGTDYLYSQIKRVYYKYNEDNVFGDKVSPSILIELKDGKNIDLWEFDENSYIEKEVIPFLKTKGIQIEK